MIDILYINYNSSNILLNSIESVYQYCKDIDFNIYVWDNNSDDDVQQIKQHYPEVKILFSKKNIGFGSGVNQLLKIVDSQYYVILNPDTLITENFLQQSIDFLASNLDVGLFGPKVLDFNGEVQGSARAFPTPLTSLFGRNSPLTKLFPNNAITTKNILTLNHDFKTPAEVDWVSGACMIIRREAMQVVRGFDERFFLYWEDTDLCWRIKNAGWKVVYNPETTVTHFVGESSSTRPVFANYQFHKSCYRLYVKYSKGSFSIFCPIAGVALMLRFLLAVGFNAINRALYSVNNSRCRNISVENAETRLVRILRIISRTNIGGPSIHVKNLTENLNTRHFDTRLITGRVSPNEGDMEYIFDINSNNRTIIPELQREISLFYDLKALIKIVREIKRFNPHIIHSHTSKAGTLSRTAAFICNLFRKHKIITIHTFHGNVLDGYFSRSKSSLILWIERLMARLTDVIIAISKTQKWELSNVYKIGRPDKILPIKLGFDLKPFQSAGGWKGLVHQKFSISDDDLLIGIVGRMVPIKNHKMFLDAGKSFADRQKKKRVKFLIVGDGEERQALEDYAARLGLKQNIVFTGWEKELDKIYADLDVLALTSLNEGTPVSVIEAMAAGVPVVTTGVGGIKDLLGKILANQPDHGVFKICERGILCPKGDPIAFSEALSYMFDSGYLEDKERFRKASEYVVENYSIGRLVNDIESLYENLLKSKSN